VSERRDGTESDEEEPLDPPLVGGASKGGI